jgi:flagellar hook-basal body complex protein FliE
MNSMIDFSALYSQNAAKGDIIQLKTSQDGHFSGKLPGKAPEDTSVNFANALTAAIEKVNDQQVNAESLAQQMVADPSSVEIHTVRIAAEKARMALTFTKSIGDLAVKTYRELTNLR